MEIKIINKSKNPLPKYESKGAGAMDLKADLSSTMAIHKGYNYGVFKKGELSYVEDTIIMYPNSVVTIPTGLFMEIPQGYVLDIRPRSGMSLKMITVGNSPGTIDSDYRGEIMVILVNHGDTLFEVKNGDKVAQCLLEEVIPIEWIEVKELSSTERGEGGFGSTDKNNK